MGPPQVEATGLLVGSRLNPPWQNARQQAMSPTYPSAELRLAPTAQDPGKAGLTALVS